MRVASREKLIVLGIAFFALPERAIEPPRANEKWITSEMIEEMERAETTNRNVDDINRAIDKANAGRYDEALAIMDELLPRITDAAMLERAREFRAEVATRAKKK